MWIENKKFALDKTFYQSFMKNKIFFSVMIVLICIPALSKEQVTLGVSQVNITPEEPVIMSGYDARKTPSTGVHDSLFASALFFSSPQNKALLIIADVIGFPHAFVDTVKQMISAKTGIASANIMIIALHNHGGPAIHTYEAELPQANDDYIASLKQKLVTLSSNAMQKPVPFRMGIGKGTCTMNINRRAVFADGGVWLGRNPDGPCDHELDVIKFVDDKNKLIAVLVNWPCHGTVSGQDNYLLTGDWPGAAARYIKKSLGNDVVVAITAGASADINPIYGPGDDFNEVEAVGYHVADEFSKTLSQIKKLSAPKSVEMTSSMLSFPGKKSWTDQFPQTSVATGNNVDIRFTAMKVGSLVLCGISGELMTQMGMQIKKGSPYSSTVVVTHCNGSSGYICTDKAFTEGGYETKVSHLMPGVEQPLVKKCLDMIKTF
jgi:neutral ceramidase